MSNLNTLFDISKFGKRKQANQKKFEEDNRPLLVDFRSYVYYAFKNLHKKILAVIEPLDQNNNLPAVVMNGYLVGQFIRNYASFCGEATKQRFKMVIGGESIYVKKLDEKTRLPSNIPTDQSLMIINNLTDSDSDKGPNIFLGYTVNEEWSMITGVYAVYAKGQSVIWKTDLLDFGESDQTPIITIRPTPISPKVKPGVNKKKTKKDADL